MVALISLFVIVITSLLVTRVATVMLTLTGISRESARFQARSAFTGVGFATAESEAVVNHPVRRRIVMALMLAGNAGIATGLASLVLAFNSVSDSAELVTRVLIILGGLTVLWRLSLSQLADRLLSRLIERALRRFTDLDVRDYAGLLRLADQWMVGEIEIREGDWLCDVPLSDLDLHAEGVLVLGIERSDGRWVGAPNTSARLHDGDVAVMYGKRDTLERIDSRERTAEGEMDWVTSQIEFTAEYLEQQEIDRQAASAPGTDEPPAPQLSAGERRDESPSGEPEPEPEDPLDRSA